MMFSCVAFSSPGITPYLFFFFFNDTATTEIYTLSLHDALPISGSGDSIQDGLEPAGNPRLVRRFIVLKPRSEEHTSELQSRLHLVCRLLLEKKKKKTRQKPRISTRRHTVLIQAI